MQALEEAGLAARRTDPSDRRASILDLSEEGRDVLERTRAHRRERLEIVLSDWSDEERAEFGRLLGRFNASVERLIRAQTKV